MSSDWSFLWTHPASLAWDPTQEENLRQHYRELNAPLVHYLLGLSRSLVGLPALPADWDWSKSWAENEQTGALPDPRLLYIGRLGVTLLIPVSLILTYFLGKRLDGPLAGLISAFLVGSNALVLLHGRRAMAESGLLLSTTFALLTFIYGSQLPWLAGLGMALAFNAKQSTLALLPVGMLAVSWLPGWPRLRIGKVAVNLATYLGVFLGVTLLLNPLVWKSPLQASLASIKARGALLQNQVSMMNQTNPWQVLHTPSQRVASLLANLYFLPPSFQEASNYRMETQSSESAYLSVPGHDLLRGFIGGSFLMIFSLAGLAFASISLKRASADRRRTILILFLATAAQAAALLIAIPLNWQRYIIPLIPLVCLWAGGGLATLWNSIYPFIYKSQA